MIPALLAVSALIACGLLLLILNERACDKPNRREYRDADRLLRGKVWHAADTEAALLRCWIADTKPRRWWQRAEHTTPAPRHSVAAPVRRPMPGGSTR